MKIFRNKKIFLFLFLANIFAELPNLSNIRPFQKDGEKLKFNLTYFGLVGGYATLLSTPLRDKLKVDLYGSSIKLVNSVFNLKIYLSSLLNAENFQVLKHLESRRENKLKYYFTQKYFIKDKYFYYSYRRKNIDFEQNKINIKNNGGLSIIGLLQFARTTDLVVGETYNTVSFVKNLEKKVKINVLRKEKIDTKFGKVATVVINLDMDFSGIIHNNKRFDMYLTDDEYKIPVLIEISIDFYVIKAQLIEGHPKWESLID